MKRFRSMSNPSLAQSTENVISFTATFLNMVSIGGHDVWTRKRRGQARHSRLYSRACVADGSQAAHPVRIACEVQEQPVKASGAPLALSTDFNWYRAF